MFEFCIIHLLKNEAFICLISNLYFKNYIDEISVLGNQTRNMKAAIFTTSCSGGLLVRLSMGRLQAQKNLLYGRGMILWLCLDGIYWLEAFYKYQALYWSYDKLWVIQGLKRFVSPLIAYLLETPCAESGSN